MLPVYQQIGKDPNIYMSALSWVYSKDVRQCHELFPELGRSRVYSPVIGLRCCLSAPTIIDIRKNSLARSLTSSVNDLA